LIDGIEERLANRIRGERLVDPQRRCSEPDQPENERDPADERDIERE
jgi:hypothetical protein